MQLKIAMHTHKQIHVTNDKLGKKLKQHQQKVVLLIKKTPGNQGRKRRTTQRKWEARIQTVITQKRNKSNKRMNRCSTSILKRAKLETTLTYHFSPSQHQEMQVQQHVLLENLPEVVPRWQKSVTKKSYLSLVGICTKIGWALGS